MARAGLGHLQAQNRKLAKVHVLPINVIGLKNVRQIRYIVIRYNYKTRYSILDLYTFQKIKEFIFFFLIH